MISGKATNFGVTAYIAANLARSGHCGLRERLALAVCALGLDSDQHGARAAVRYFLQNVDARPVPTGERLRNFIDIWIGEDAVTPVAGDIRAARDAQRMFDWQTRKDCGHD